VKYFWSGFYKKADSTSLGDGGKGFTGTGKGNITSQLERSQAHGTIESGPEKADHTLLDRERNPRDFSPFQNGPSFEDENGTHIIY
jgi:hypothetical protein